MGEAGRLRVAEGGQGEGRWEGARAGQVRRLGGVGREVEVGVPGSEPCLSGSQIAAGEQGEQGWPCQLQQVLSHARCPDSRDMSSAVCKTDEMPVKSQGKSARPKATHLKEARGEEHTHIGMGQLKGGRLDLGHAEQAPVKGH